MTDLLTSGWFEAATEALATAAASDAGPVGAPDASVEVDIVVSGGDAPVTARCVVEGGRLVAVHEGGPGDPAATIPQSRTDFASMVAGDLDPAVAFMRGDLKPEGQAAAVLAFVSAMNRPEARAALAGVAG